MKPLDVALTLYPTKSAFWTLIGGMLRKQHETKTQKEFISQGAWHALTSIMLKTGQAENDSWNGMSQVFLPWVYSQRIYTLDPVLVQALSEKPVAQVPAAVLAQLPDWAIYITIELPDGDYISPGFWVALTEPAIHEREYYGQSKVLRIILIQANADVNDTDKRIVYITLKVDLEKTIGDMVDEYFRSPDRLTDNAMDEAMLNVLLASVLFLCSDAPEVVNTREPIPIQFKRSLRKRTPTTMVLRPKRPRHYAVGEEFGKQIQQHRARVKTMNLGSCKPHIRAAHWHTFLAGPRDKPRERRVKWINAVLVNFKEAELDNS